MYRCRNPLVLSLRFCGLSILLAHSAAGWPAKALCLAAGFPSNLSGFFLSVHAENTCKYPSCRLYVVRSLQSVVSQPIFWSTTVFLFLSFIAGIPVSQSGQHLSHEPDYLTLCRCWDQQDLHKTDFFSQIPELVAVQYQAQTFFHTWWSLFNCITVASHAVF